MEREELYRTIFRRRSVRRYSQETLSGPVLADLRSFIGELRPLVPGIGTEIRIADAGDVKGILRTDAPKYFLLFSELKDGYLANAGFLLQQIDLYLSAKGLGNCYQGMAKPVKGIDGPSGMEFVISMSFGMPAEELHRKDQSEFQREPLSRISSVRGMDKVMEAVRLAPSGINNQSWYFTGDDGTVHAFSKRSMITDRMNRINVGIALCHMWLAAEHEGIKAEFAIGPVGAEMVPKGHSYVASMRFDGKSLS